MTRNLHLTLHLGRKVFVRSLTRDAEIDLPYFHRDDEIVLAVTMVHDAEDPTAEVPFVVVDTEGWDVRVAIGNALGGTARRLLAQTLSFFRDSDGVFHGTLSLRTQEAADYLFLPGLYDEEGVFAIGDEVYFQGLTYRRSADASAENPENNPEAAPYLWSSYEIYRDPLYFEVVLVRPEGREIVAQVGCIVAEPVIHEPPLSPNPIENLDALADAMAQRLVPSTSVMWDRNRDPHSDQSPAAPTYDPAVGVNYLGRIFDPSIQKYFQAIREIKAPVDLAWGFDITLFHLPATIDGVTPAGHARFVAMGNIDPSTGGIYTVEAVGESLIAPGSTLSTPQAGGLGKFTITVTVGKLYWIELGPNETVSVGFDTITQSGTVGAAANELRVVGLFGAPVRTIVRAAGGVRASDALNPEQLAPGTAFRVLLGSSNADKRYALSSEVEQVGVSHQTFIELTLGTGPILPGELEFFAEALGAYSAPAYDSEAAYAVGDQFKVGTRTYVVHTAMTGEAPEDRLYCGELLEFNPRAYLVASVRVRDGGGLKVGAQGVEVDYEAIAPDTYPVDSEAQMLLLPAKPGDYAIRSDLGNRPYRLDQLPATDLANWLSLDAERIEAGPNVPTQSRYRASGVARIDTQVPHGLFTGNEVAIRDVGGDGYNLTGVSITVTSETAFNYECPGDDEIPATEDTGGYVVKLIPIVTRPVTLTTDTPTGLVVGGVGSPGSGQRAAREDHAHPMPGLATTTTAGFMSPAHFALIEGLGGSSGMEVGFDLPVECLLADGGKIWVGGQFTRYGTAVRNRIALLDNRGRVDPQFEPLSGFTQPVIRLAKASDGTVVAGSSIYNNYQGLSGGHVWKLLADGGPDLTWNCPLPLAASGDNTLVGLSTAGTAIVAITPNALRMLDSSGADLINATSNAPLHDVLGYNSTCFLSGAAFAAGGADAIVNGLISPRALKLLGVEATPECPCLAGTLVPSFSTNAGDGANASVRRLVVYRSYDGDYVIGGTPRDASEEDGVDHSWDGGNALRFRGLFKIGLDGLADETFEVDLSLSEAGAAIPFAVDSLGRIYFGGPVAAINGLTVTPWRLYRITALGEFDAVFDAFNDKVLCAVLLDDNNLVVGGAFTTYGTRPAGRIAFLNAAGEVVLPDATQPVGRVVTRYDLPDVALDPKAQYDLVRMPPSTPGDVVSLWIHDPLMGWMDICSVCRVQGDNLPALTFDPPSGTAIGAGLLVGLRAAGYGIALIRYTLDGSVPSSSSALYSSPIAIATPTTIKAYASLPGGRADGPLSVAQYDVAAIEQLPAPTFSPTTGEPPVTVSILPPAGHGDAQLRYTVDGSPASEASILYVAPIAITSATTLRAIAIKPGYQNSPEIAASYQASQPPPQPRTQIVRSVPSDLLMVQVPEAPSIQWLGLTVEYSIMRNGTYTGWIALVTSAGQPTANASIPLRQGSGYPFGMQVSIILRSRVQKGGVTLYSLPVSVLYIGSAANNPGNPGVIIT